MADAAYVPRWFLWLIFFLGVACGVLIGAMAWT